MSRLLFGAGAQGPLVQELQAGLLGHGCDPKGCDGLYGQDTAAAVRAFQRAAAAPVTGETSDELWPAITGRPVPGLEERCLQLTSTFEGHGYTLAQGNWDGAWLTWGIIGFTLKSGEVQAIVRAVEQQAPDAVRGAFGPEAGELLRIVDAPAAEQAAWADRLTVGARLAEPWRAHFACFGGLPVVQGAQRARVHDGYFVPASCTAAALGLTSELGVALAFDIHVQNGGVRRAVRAEIEAASAGRPEWVVREALANAVADRARARFREDVRARKLAIARGEGVVHGRRVVLAAWGLAGRAA